MSPSVGTLSSRLMHGGLRFGLFQAPFHAHWRNPTLQLQRDLDLCEWLDHLGFDEYWFGEHHSGGWEIITSPDLMIAAASQRTSRIKLGTGVVSVPYHTPFQVAERMVLLDHLTKGRVMFGVGPGALPSDAYMMGMDPKETRPRMEQALEAICHLLRSDEPLTMDTHWFKLREARLQLSPYSDPLFDICMATTVSPNGPRSAGQFGGAVLSMSATTDAGFEALGTHWDIWNMKAQEHGHTADRSKWRIVAPVHIAETTEQAFKDVEHGIEPWVRYFREVVALPGAPDTDDRDEFVRAMVDGGFAVIGTPDDAAALVDRFWEQSGGFGALLVFGNDWANPQATRRSFELLIEEVAPRYQGSIRRRTSSHAWTAANREEFLGRAAAASQEARERHEAEMAAKHEQQ